MIADTDLSDLLDRTQFDQNSNTNNSRCVDIVSVVADVETLFVRIIQIS